MYKAIYRVKTQKTEKEEVSYSVLKAEFRFEEDVAPKDRDKIKERCRYRDTGGALSWYLLNKEKLFVTRSSFQPLLGKNKQVRIKTCRFNLGFDIIVEARESVPLEKMLNLDALNEYILRGDKP